MSKFSSKSLSVSTCTRDTDTQACLKQVRWDTLESTMSLLISFLPRFLTDIFLTDIFNIMSSIIITSLLLFQNTQFPHTRRSPHNVPHSSSYNTVYESRFQYLQQKYTFLLHSPHILMQMVLIHACNWDSSY